MKEENLLNINLFTIMTKTEQDYFEETQKVINTRKDFRALIPPFLSNKITYNPIGFNRPNFETTSFIVDWQLSMEDDSETLWY